MVFSKLYRRPGYQLVCYMKGEGSQSGYKVRSYIQRGLWLVFGFLWGFVFLGFVGFGEAGFLGVCVVWGFLFFVGLY